MSPRVNAGWAKELNTHIMKTRKILNLKLDELISKRHGLRKSILCGQSKISKGILVNSLISVSKQISILEWVLNSESTVSISASKDESGILHDVAECNAERESTDELNEEDVEGTLQKIIDCESLPCSTCNNDGELIKYDIGTYPCATCGGKRNNHSVT